MCMLYDHVFINRISSSHHWAAWSVSLWLKMQHPVWPKNLSSFSLYRSTDSFVIPALILRRTTWKGGKGWHQSSAVIDVLSCLSQCWFRAPGIVETNSLPHWFLFLPGSVSLSLKAQSWLRMVSSSWSDQWDPTCHTYSVTSWVQRVEQGHRRGSVDLWRSMN